MNKPAEQLSYKTVFVQNVPTTCTNEQLHEVFSVIGPIREAFVNRPKNLDDFVSDNKSLVGFVTFLSHDDAEKAAQSRPGAFIVEKRRLKVCFAKKKLTIKKKKKQDPEENEISAQQYRAADIIADFGFEIVPIQKSKTAMQKPESVEDAMDPEVEDAMDPQVEDVMDTQVEEPKPLIKNSKNFQVVISGFPDHVTIESFVELWQQKGFAVPEQFSIVNEKKGSKICRKAVAKMARKQSALKILTHLNGFSFGGATLKATLVLDPNSEDFLRTAKRSRMIVRNLSFGIKEKHLRDAFEKYGTITEINLPLKSNGKQTGYAFVQLSHVFESLRAIKEVNMSEIAGRKVAVDLCLPRDEYKQRVESEKPKEVHDESMDVGSDEESDDEDERSDDSSNDDDKSESSSMSGSDDDDGLESDEEEYGTDEDRSDDDESDSGGSEKELKKPVKKESERPIKKKSNDAVEGKTVFLRNLPFDITQNKLEEEMNKFGTYKYCLIVMNPDTGFSKGTAFVQFDTKEMADECVTTIEDQNTPLIMDERRAKAAIAQTREDLKKHLKDKAEEKKDRDTRNLYLASEGIVRPGTLAAEGVSDVEMKKRLKIEMAKRHKLKNPNVIVSETRLCIHNIPRSVDDRKLWLVCKDALKGAKGSWITECRVMRDLKHVDQTGVGRSYGYAFVNFTEHQHALFALRTLNNNPDIFGSDKRPIVEFSLEDKRVLKTKEQRRRKQMTRNEEQRKLKQEKAEEEASKPPPNRKALRIEKLREKRQEIRMVKRGENPTSIRKKTSEAIEEANKTRKSFVGGSCLTSGGKKVRLPKHIGPKIRQRNKAQVLDRLRESKKLNKPNKKWENTSIKRTKTNAASTNSNAPSTNSNQMRFKSYQKNRKAIQHQNKSKTLKRKADFDKLVANYTQKFKSGAGTNAPRLKWFN